MRKLRLGLSGRNRFVFNWHQVGGGCAWTRVGVHVEDMYTLRRIARSDLNCIGPEEFV